MTSGIHHVTAITRKVQANVDFYAGFLGLRLVKRTGGYEDAEQLHLFYGDAAGRPGSLVTFLAWEDGAPGRVGHGQVAEIAFAVPKDSIGTWLTRALEAGLAVDGPSREFGEPVLRLKDPDRIIVKLVGSDAPASAPLSDPAALTRLRAVTLLTDSPEATGAFIGPFGYRETVREGATRRWTSDSDALDIRDASGFVPGIPGTGIIDHVAFRAGDADTLRRIRTALEDYDGATNVHDRKYFLSLYVREPAGILIEHATDGPGMAVDEDMDNLGETLFVPEGDAARAEDLRVMLPQIALPGEERIVMRDLPFTHRFHRPEHPNGHVILTLHGTGGNETDLFPLAARIDPDATLLGVRGRSTEEGVTRFFRRLDMTRFDQDDIRSEAAAFNAFLEQAQAAYDLDAEAITVLGYSNGANFAAAVAGLYPGRIRRAILLRPLMPLEDLPQADLSSLRLLTVTGAEDPYGRLAPRLNDWAEASGATLDARRLPTGHGLTHGDLDLARGWLEDARVRGETR
ncbi:phospholipase/carboxylesterase [Tranquillimonas rosea]|uniref:Phospholipase/carboxylesterase n=1 Tax=Tranquillimonas rosea TaxID=641238 RepID=A0A1H9S5Y0_9RHOB|nr:VOC family protein [Tranquillimonas rosea]SER80380.1 phospholipase/carboxylesterase [Tranquillimonas rosea]